MGNSQTKLLVHGDDIDDDNPLKSGIPRSVSSSSLSSNSSEEELSVHVELDEKEAISCAVPIVSKPCIPTVFKTHQKDSFLLLRSSDTGSEDETLEDDDSDSDERGRSSRRTCSTSSRHRSWSPRSVHRFSFFRRQSFDDSSPSSFASVLSKSRRPFVPGYSKEELAMTDGHLPTHQSDLTRLRDYFIITTASLPWFTGTAVNPTMKAASLSRYQRQKFSPGRSTVTLVLPWLDVAEDRHQVYGDEWVDKTQADQEALIREWLTSADMVDEALPPEQGGIRILFYPARYHPKLCSIFAMGDLCECIVNENNLAIPDDAVCVLEEPEHLHFYRDTNIREHFSFVVGVVHTNYKAYASSAIPGGSLITGPLMASVSSWLVRAYCDKVIKLSPVLQSFDCPEKEIVCNSHGIRQDFLVEGKRRAQASAEENGEKIYFVGKLLWQKGLDKLLELETFYRNTTGEYFPIDIYGSGPDRESIESAFKNTGSFLMRGRSFESTTSLVDLANSSDDSEPAITEPINETASKSSRLSYVSTLMRPKPPVPANFMGREDHAKLTAPYRIFVNPSITEVLCTTTAEATAMGKWVIIPDHPSNTFFKRFPNCLLYKTKNEFVEFLQFAMSHEPEPLREDMRYQLTWDAATERFIMASAITRRDAKWRERRGKTKVDEKLAKLHSDITGGVRGDVLRKVLGAGPIAEQNQYDLERTQSQSATYNEAADAEMDALITISDRMSPLLLFVNICCCLMGNEVEGQAYAEVSSHWME